VLLTAGLRPADRGLRAAEGAGEGDRLGELCLSLPGREAGGRDFLERAVLLRVAGLVGRPQHGDKRSRLVLAEHDRGIKSEGFPDLPPGQAAGVRLADGGGE
jgi:hypothetical protein